MKQVNNLKTPLYVKSSDLAKLLRISYTKLVYYLTEIGVVGCNGHPENGYESWIYNQYGSYGIEREILLTPKGQNGVLNMLIKDGLSEVTKDASPSLIGKLKIIGINSVNPLMEMQSYSKWNPNEIIIFKK